MKILIVEDEPSLRGDHGADPAPGTVCGRAGRRLCVGARQDRRIRLRLHPAGHHAARRERPATARRASGSAGRRESSSFRPATRSDDKIEGLELGADDYLPKPFHLAELSARIRSVVRRHQRGGQESLDAGNVRLFPDSRRVKIAGQEVELLRKEYDILYYFMSRPNHMIDKTTLAEAVWGATTSTKPTISISSTPR